MAPPNPTAADRQGYWRSLDDLADTPEFRAFAQEEFPGFANVYEGLGEAEPRGDSPGASVDRRKFLALSAAALGLAGLAGCRRPEIPILPFSAVPDDQVGQITPGKPTFYATCLPRPGGALPVLVESHEGRPTKVEGNPLHPSSRGSTDVFAQASVLDLYSPDRVMSDKYPGVMERGVVRTWDDFDTFARSEADRLVKEKGKGLAVLAEDLNSPSVRLVREYMKQALPEAAWFTHEPVGPTEARKGAEIAFGSRLVARYNLEKADRILALDSDFLGLGPDQIAHSRGFAARRRVETPKDAMSRLYAVESTFTVTGTMADHRLRMPSGLIGGLLIAVAKELTATHKDRLKKPAAIPAQLAGLPTPTGLNEAWGKAVAKDLAENAGKCAVIVGDRQPAWAHALAHVVNDVLGNIEAGVVVFHEPPLEATDRGIVDLVKEIAADKVTTLLILGGNPVLTAPGDLNFKAALQKVTRKVRLGLFFDHTSEVADWHLPLAHSLEGWGDAETSDGTLCCVQPLIAPLTGGRVGDTANDFTPPRGGRTVLEVLTLFTQYAIPGSDPKTNPPTASYLLAKARAYELVRKVFADRSGLAMGSAGFETEFNRYKQLGFLPANKDRTGRKPKPPADLKLDPTRVGSEVAKAALPPAPTRDGIELVFVPSYTTYDGRYATNPWLQELPDPITKLVWDNAALISPKTAAEFRVSTGDVIRITARDSTPLEVPVFILPGQADWSITLSFGQSGDMRIGHVPEGGGTNVFPARRSEALHFYGGCKIEATGRTADLVTTQEHGVIPEGREIIKEYTLPEYQKVLVGGPHDTPALHGPWLKVGLNPNQLPDEHDLKKGFQGAYGNPQQLPAPIRQKQERFPLDLARPELLDSQFQWGMVIDLNTCTGCSACMVACQSENNIPVVGKHEVKRNRELHWIRIDRYFRTPAGSPDEPQIVTQPVACVHCEQAPCETVCPVNASVHSPEGLNLQVYNRCIGTRYCANACPYKVRRFNWFDFNKRPLDQLRVPTPLAEGGSSLMHSLLPETLKMQKNPDVTVRMRGVMEKCTYCVQRLERAKIGAKIAATEVAQGRKAIEADASFKPEGRDPSAYRKPKDPRAAGYDLDAAGRVIVPDGMVTTACAAACPSGAIVFGNALDPTSRVAKLKKTEAEYLLLGELNTKPRTSYLPRVRNPNPELGEGRG